MGFFPPCFKLPFIRLVHAYSFLLCKLQRLLHIFKFVIAHMISTSYYSTLHLGSLLPVSTGLLSTIAIILPHITARFRWIIGNMVLYVAPQVKILITGFCVVIYLTIENIRFFHRIGWLSFVKNPSPVLVTHDDLSNPCILAKCPSWPQPEGQDRPVFNLIAQDFITLK